MDPNDPYRRGLYGTPFNSYGSSQSYPFVPIAPAPPSSVPSFNPAFAGPAPFFASHSSAYGATPQPYLRTTPQPLVHEGLIPSHGSSAYYGPYNRDLYPRTPTPLDDIIMTDANSQESEDEEGDDDDDDDSVFEQQMALQEALIGNDSDVDPDFDPVDEAALDADEGEEDELDEAETPSKSRGRKRGKGVQKKESVNVRKRKRSPGNGLPFKGRRRKGPNKAADPSPKFKDLQKRATEAWMQKRHTEALELAQMAVKENPEISSAHDLISKIYRSLNEEEHSLGALMGAATTARQPSKWWEVIDRANEIFADNETSRDQQVSDSLLQILSLDKKNYKAKRMRKDLNMKYGRFVYAMRDCEVLLQWKPEINGPLSDLYEAGIQSKQLSRSIAVFEKYIAQYQNTGRDRVTWDVINFYLDLQYRIGQNKVGLEKAKQLSRYRLSREKETFWDEVPDDREWDNEDEPRRIHVKKFKPAGNHLQTHGKGLYPEIRVRMGLFRLAMGPDDFEEAIRHFDCLIEKADSEDSSVADFADLFLVVADALKRNELLSDAVRFYEPLVDLSTQEDADFLHSLAECYRDLGKTDELERVFSRLLFLRPWDTVAKIGLAKIYEQSGRRDELRRQVEELKRMGQADQVRKAHIQLPTGQVLFSHPTLTKPSMYMDPEKIAKKTERKTRTQHIDRLLKQLTEAEEEHESIMQSFQDLKSTQEDVDTGDEDALEEWMELAGKLVDDFQSQKVFFPADSSQKFKGYTTKAGGTALLMRMQEDAIRAPDQTDENGDVEDRPAPDDFRGIKFDEWVSLTCEYALKLAIQGNRDRCYEVLEKASAANVVKFHDQRKLEINNCLLACTLALKDEKKILDVCRFYFDAYPYATDVYRMFSVVSRIYQGTRTWYRSGPSQKYVLRKIIAMDYAILTPAERAQYKLSQFQVSTFTGGGTHDGNPHGLKELDPALLALYGHLMSYGGSWSAALNYYLRAFTLVPLDPVLNLCLATSYVQLAMKRTALNRTYLTQQGLAFLMRYYEIRSQEGAPAIFKQEAEFNVARYYHFLGTTHLALPAYEKVLELSKDVEKEDLSVGTEDEWQVKVKEDFAPQAAFAMQTILATSGDVEGARKVTKKWLVM